MKRFISPRNIILVTIISFLYIGSPMAQVTQSESKDVKKATKVTLQGILSSSSDGERLVGAYVYLGKDNDKPVAITDSLGQFSLKCFVDSLSTISFSYIGFNSLTRRYILKRDTHIGVIKLAPDVLNIDEVVVSAQQPLTVQKGDTTEFNPAALKLAEDADLEKLLKKLPGFEVVNGKIMAQGEEVKKILVDGKTYFLNNPSAALKNLPADLVAKVKMFDDKSEEAKFSGYDDGKKYRSLNIVTKNPNAMKTFGNTSGNYGISDEIKNTFRDNRYGLNLSGSLFDNKRRISISGDINSTDQANTLENAKYAGKGGENGNKNLNVNYSSDLGKKITLTANYNLSSNKSYSGNSSRQDYFPSEKYESRIYDSENHSWNNNMNHSVNMQLEYKISKKDRITFAPTINFSNGSSRSENYASTVENTDTLNKSKTRNLSDNDNLSLGGRLSWMHAFKKQGRTLTTSVDFRKSDNNSVQNQIIKEYFLNNENIGKDTLRNKRNETGSDNYSMSASVSYSEPLSKNSRISINYSFDTDSDNNNKESFSYRDEEFNDLIGLDSTLTQGTGVMRMYNRFGVNYNYSKKDKIRFSVGGNVSATGMDNEYLFLGVKDSLVKSNYYDISPRADFDYKISKNKNLNTSYNGNTSSPSASQLQDILDVSNPLQVSKGNPNLKKSFRHSLSVRYSSSNSEKSTYMSASVSANQSFNVLTSNVQFINSDTTVNGYLLQKGTRLSSPVNLNGGWGINANANYSFSIKPIKLMINTSLRYGYSHSPSIYDNINTFNNSHNTGVNIGFTSIISENIDFNVNSNTSYSNSKSTQSGKSELFNQSVNGNFRWVFWKGFLIGGNLAYTYYLNKKGDAINQSSTMLDLEIGKKFGKRKQFQLRFTASDILRQRNLINYSLFEHYSQTSYITNTDSYYTLSLSYRFMNMGKKGKSEGENRQRGGAHYNNIRVMSRHMMM